MIQKITMCFIATATIVITFAFTTSKTKHDTTYSIDTKGTTITWLGKKITGQHSGTIAISKGSIVSNHGNITGGSIEFNMATITCTDIIDPKSNEYMVTHLKSNDFFSVEKNPTATFEITKAVLKSDNDYDVTGKLTIKGITNEITFPAMIKMDETTFVTVAKIIVNRTKFDIQYSSATFFENIGDKAINDDFELNVNMVAKATK